LSSDRRSAGAVKSVCLPPRLATRPASRP
jgi:hypothetical protein